MQRLFKQFSFPGGIPSHAAPETPGSINEGGELGYSLLHAYGAVFDNPDLIACCVVGDGEAETGALATSWHSNKFLNPARDGAVLPILHLNGYKIAGPTVLARIPEDELRQLLRRLRLPAGTSLQVTIPRRCISRWPRRSMSCSAKSGRSRQDARSNGFAERPAWPMIVLRSPKGWTGPKEVDGKQIEGTFRAHQVPLAEVRTNPEHLHMLEEWMKSYRPDELFDENGRLRARIRRTRAQGRSAHGCQSARQRRSAADAISTCPIFATTRSRCRSPVQSEAEATRVTGRFLRDVMR